MFPGAFVCPPSPVPPFFFSSCTVPGRRTTTTYPQLRPSPKLSSRPLKALPKLLSDSVGIRKSRLLEISFNRKPSSFPLGVCTLPNSLRGNCRSPLHPHSTTRPSNHVTFSRSPLGRPSLRTFLLNFLTREKISLLT